MQYQRMGMRLDPMLQHRLAYQKTGILCGFILPDLTSDDISTVDVKNEVQVTEHPLRRACQIGDIPCTHLQRAGRTVCGFMLGYRFSSSSAVILFFLQPQDAVHAE